jgi:hypothetical protein
MGPNRRDHLVAALVVGVCSGAGLVAARLAVVRYFFGWPTGGVWSNTIASLIWVLLVMFFTWYFRDVLGPRVAAFWSRHHRPHAEEHHEGTRTHVTSELVGLEQRVNARFDAIEQLIRDAGGN